METRFEMAEEAHHEVRKDVLVPGVAGLVVKVNFFEAEHVVEGCDEVFE